MPIIKKYVQKTKRCPKCNTVKPVTQYKKGCQICKACKEENEGSGRVKVVKKQVSEHKLKNTSKIQTYNKKHDERATT